MAGLAVAAALYMPGPSHQAQPSAPKVSNPDSLPSALEHSVSLEGMEGAVVLGTQSEESRYGSHAFSEEWAQAGSSPSQFSDLEIGKAVVSYKVQSAEVSSFLAPVHAVLKDGHSGIELAVNGAVAATVQEGFLGDHMDLFHTDPQALAAAFQNKVQEKLNERIYHSPDEGPNPIHITSVDLSQVCKLSYDTSTSFDSSAPIATQGSIKLDEALVASECVGGTAFAPTPERGNVQKMLEERRAQAESWRNPDLKADPIVRVKI